MNTLNILLVGLGGFAGSVARYLTVIAVEKKLHPSFPYGTLTVNIAGSFILGVVLAWVGGKTEPGSEPWKLLLGTGFCGGFTTFSAFAAENVRLLSEGLTSAPAIYILVSLIGGLLAVLAGLGLMRLILS